MNTVSTPCVQAPVHQRHLELVLEIRHGAQPSHDRGGVVALGTLDEQPVERVDRHGRFVREDLPQQGDPLFGGERRRLPIVHQNGHHDPVEQTGSTPDDIHVAVGEWIERSGIDGDAHLKGNG